MENRLEALLRRLCLTPGEKREVFSVLRDESFAEHQHVVFALEGRPDVFVRHFGHFIEVGRWGAYSVHLHAHRDLPRPLTIRMEEAASLSLVGHAPQIVISHHQPERFSLVVERILELAIPRARQSEYVGDLLEEFREDILPDRSVWFARFWLVRHAVSNVAAAFHVKWIASIAAAGTWLRNIFG